MSSQNEATGLEDHLRGLILTNASSTSNGPENSQETPSGDSAAVLGSSPSQHSQQFPPSPRTGKKRLNQAQRRQMNAQLTIPVDTRPSYPPAGVPQHNGRGGHYQQWHPVAPHQRAMSGPSYGPPPGFGRGGHMGPARGGRGNGYRGGYHQHHASAVDSYSNHANGHPAAAPAGWRQGPSHAHSQSGPHYNNNNHHRRPFFRPDEVANQSALLDRLCFNIVADSEIQRDEIMEKEAFRTKIEGLIRLVIAKHEHQQTQSWDFPPESVELKCFGSLASGFATKASDMDLALLSPLSQVKPETKTSPIPRLIEKALLEVGIGARLLTRTRVPIIKLCECPPESLYRNLLANRDKWEKGLEENDGHEFHEDDEHDHDEHHDPATTSPTVPAAAISGGDVAAPHDKEDEERASNTVFEVPSTDKQSQEPQKLFLRQSPGSSLESYYSTAKRVLRKAGGRDVRAPTSHGFGPLQWEVLNRVCQAFVQGLSNTEVRDKLQSFPSLSFKPIDNMPDNHSLATTFTQIEGEHLAYDWNRWLEDQGMDMETGLVAQDPEGAQVVRLWHAAQRKTDYGIDPSRYNKELTLLVERMKKISTFQVVSLEQGSEEAPTRYYTRAAAILNNLRGSGLHLVKGPEAAVVKQYVAGIRPKEIKSVVSEYAEAHGEATLHDVAQRHKSLQLAREFTRAAEKGLYDQGQVDDVKEYVKLLESPLIKTETGEGKSVTVVPVTSQSTEDLVTRVSALQDPHLLAPNQSRYKDHLEFPKTGAGVQCDINFSAHLALHNTALLRCYSHSDPRVRIMVLFIKHWAKTRGINSGYRGTLSSYGYVLMVLHYLVNVVQPFVCPNLQHLGSANGGNAGSALVIDGYNVQFWRNEDEIRHLASLNQLNRNTESIGSLLRGFFEYYAQTGFMSSGHGKGFDWGRDVISLRTPGGLLSKQDKGWTGAKTVYETNTTPNAPAPATEPTASAAPSANTPAPPAEVKEVRLRYLFAIEDPFETDHNVARTVTHNGIVSIRDELRRAWRIIKSAGPGGDVTEALLEDVNDASKSEVQSLAHLMDEIHGTNFSG